MILETVNSTTAITNESQLELLESVASEHLVTFKKAYWNFVQALQAIRNSGEWSKNYLTWESYLQSRWIPLLPFNSTSRIRQLEANYPIAAFIADVTKLTLNDGQIRKLRHVVPQSDLHLMPEIVSIVFEYTSTPSERHYLATYEVVRESIQYRSVSIEGESVELNPTKLAAIESMIEADRRYKEHLASGLWKMVNRYEVTPDSDVKVTGVTPQANQRIIVIIQELKEDSNED